MARLPYLEADQVAPEYRDMLKRKHQSAQAIGQLARHGARVLRPCG